MISAQPRVRSAFHDPKHRAGHVPFVTNSHSNICVIHRQPADFPGVIRYRGDYFQAIRPDT